MAGDYRSDVCGKREGVMHIFGWVRTCLRIAKRELGGGIFGHSKNDFRLERVIPYNPHTIANPLAYIQLDINNWVRETKWYEMKRETELEKKLITYWECGGYACVFKDTIAPLLPSQKNIHL
jgi:ribosomal protein S14